MQKRQETVHFNVNEKGPHDSGNYHKKTINFHYTDALPKEVLNNFSWTRRISMQDVLNKFGDKK